MMKNTSAFACKVILGIILYAMVFWLGGCGNCMPPFGGSGCAQLGETEAEGHRRHIRNATLNHQEMLGDIDRFMLFDEPGKTTPRRIP